MADPEAAEFSRCHRPKFAPAEISRIYLPRPPIFFLEAAAEVFEDKFGSLGCTSKSDFLLLITLHNALLKV